jgi:hypothetical protein
MELTTTGTLPLFLTTRVPSKVVDAVTPVKVNFCGARTGKYVVATTADAAMSSGPSLVVSATVAVYVPGGVIGWIDMFSARRLLVPAGTAAFEGNEIVPLAGGTKFTVRVPELMPMSDPVALLSQTSPCI